VSGYQPAPAARNKRDKRQRSDPAPLYSDGFALCAWLHGRLGERADELSRTVCRTALALLGYLVLALKAPADGGARDAHIADADQSLVLLRVHIQLAESTDAITQDQSLHALEIADRIGRQLGGWRRSLAHT
jgi:hypothetical protein